MHKPIIFINPELDEFSEDLIELWDDCICFPDLLVKVEDIKAAGYLLEIPTGMNILWSWKIIYRNFYNMKLII